MGGVSPHEHARSREHPDVNYPPSPPPPLSSPGRNPRNDRAPASASAPTPTPLPTAQKADLSSSASCSILTWDNDAASHGGEGQQTTTACRCRSLVSPEDLRGEIASLVAQTDVSVAATATGAAGMSSFAAAATTSSSPEQQQQARRRPLIVLHGPAEPLLSALLNSPPLDMDPAFVDAHLGRRQYRPRGVYRTRPTRERGGAGRAAHWDYPELVAGGGWARDGRRLLWRQGVNGVLTADWPGSGVGRGNLDVLFCRASLWGTEGVDVLLLDRTAWWTLGSTWGRSGGDPMDGDGMGPGWDRDGGQVTTPLKRDGRVNNFSMEGVIQEAIGAGDVDTALEDVLEEAAYDHWLEFFEVLTPREMAPMTGGRIPLEWHIMEALERNTEMRTDIERRRRRRSPEFGGFPDWERLTRRLRLRVEMISTMTPPLKGPMAQSGKREVLTQENGLATLPVARQLVSQDDSGDQSSRDKESQRALDRVTYIGGILLPFSIVSGVLSMNEDFGPGHALFWVFWVVAVPLAVVAILVIYADKLRRAEVWVAVPLKGDGFEEAEEPMAKAYGRQSMKMQWKRKGKTQGPWQEAVPRVSMPRLRVNFDDPGSVRYGAPEEVVIDLGTPAADLPTIPAEPFSPPPSVSPMPDGQQDQSKQQAGKGVVTQAVNSDADDARPHSLVHPPPPPAGMRLARLQLQIPPNTSPISTAGTDSGISYQAARQERYRLRAQSRQLRKQELGWVGAVLCMLNLRKPLLVSDGEPVEAPRRT